MVLNKYRAKSFVRDKNNYWGTDSDNRQMTDMPETLVSRHMEKSGELKSECTLGQINTRGSGSTFTAYATLAHSGTL